MMLTAQPRTAEQATDWHLVGDAEPDAEAARRTDGHYPPAAAELVCLDCPLPDCAPYSAGCINPHANAAAQHPAHRRGGTKLTDDDKRAIRARVLAGEDAYALAREYGVNRKTVQNIRAASGVYQWLRTGQKPPRRGGGQPRRLTDRQTREVRRRALAGEGKRALAREFGLHESTVGNIARAQYGYRWLADPDSTRGR